MPATLFLACILCLSHHYDAAPAMEHYMTVTKMNKEDLDSSASGYTYNQQQGLPVYYVQYTNHGSGHLYHPPESVQYIVEAAAPVAHVSPKTRPLLLPYATAEDVPHQGTTNYGNEQLLEHVVAPVNSVPRAPYYVEGKFAVNGDAGEKSGGHRDAAEDDHDDEASGEDENSEEDVKGDNHDRHIGGDIYGGSVKGYGSDYDNEGISKSRGDSGSSFEETGKGEQHQAEEYSEHGDKGEKGYKANENFSKGESGSLDSEHHEGEI